MTQGQITNIGKLQNHRPGSRLADISKVQGLKKILDQDLKKISRNYLKSLQKNLQRKHKKKKLLKYFLIEEFINTTEELRFLPKLFVKTE